LAFALTVFFTDLTARVVLAAGFAARAFVVFGAFATFVAFTARRAVPERFVLAAFTTVLRAEVRFFAVFVVFVFAVAAIFSLLRFPRSKADLSARTNQHVLLNPSCHLQG
jgi:hypothetical protein